MYRMAVAQPISDGSDARGVFHDVLAVAEIRMDLCLDEHQRTCTSVMHNNVSKLSSIFLPLLEQVSVVVKADVRYRRRQAKRLRLPLVGVVRMIEQVAELGEPMLEARHKLVEEIP